VVDIGAQSKKTFKGVGNVGFNLLRRHAVVERGYYHYWHVDLGKQIHRHLSDVDRSHKRNQQAKHDDEERKPERKLRH
jgi:hypothetical protein